MGMEILSGRTLFTGQWTRHGWSLRRPQNATKTFDTLFAVKEYAKRHGASGKWSRSVRRDGCRVVTVYSEVVDNAAPDHDEREQRKGSNQ